MKYVKQFAVIIAISFLGEILRAVIPVPIPAGIYGIVLLFIALETKLIKLDSVKGAADFLIEIMPVMFIPSAVGLMTAWGILKDHLLVYLVITVVSTFVVMLASGYVTQAVIHLREKRRKKKEEKGE